MKIWERRLICGGLGAAGVLFLVAAIKPAFNGSSLDATFFLLGVALIAGGIIAWRRSGKSAELDEISRRQAEAGPPKV